MSRFSDEWVIDRTMFEFIGGGSSCDCCGLPQLVFGGGLKGLIDACTDLETDAAASELDAVEKSPWPPQMREEVWGDRVKLRLLMKRDMKKYKTFFQEHALVDVQSWCLTTLDVDGLCRLFQMPRTEIKHIVETTYGIHSAYSIVLSTVAEQVANFEQTKYETDGFSDEEMDFEDMLYSDRRAGFVVVMKEEIKELIVEAYLQYMVKLGGPKLLAKADSNNKCVAVNANDDNDVAASSELSNTIKKQAGPSFRSDRRIIRLLIGRYWADRVIIQYTEHINKSLVTNIATNHVEKEEEEEAALATLD